MQIITIILYFVFGAIVGSFLNVVIFRLHSGRSFVAGRSACRSCGHELPPLDLVPIMSFMFLRGRCRYCKDKLSWQYPLVETLTGLVFALVGGRFGTEASMVPFAVVLSCFFIVVAVYDFKHMLILDKVVFPGIAVAFLGNLLLDLSGHVAVWRWQSHILSGLFGAVLISGFFFLQYMVSGRRWIGFGDVKYGMFLGMAAGLGGSIVLLFLAYLTGALVGLGLIAAGRKNLTSRLPFGTFLSFSAIITLLYGGTILAWYLSLIGWN